MLKLLKAAREATSGFLLDSRVGRPGLLRVPQLIMFLSSLFGSVFLVGLPVEFGVVYTVESPVTADVASVALVVTDARLVVNRVVLVIEEIRFTELSTVNDEPSIEEVMLALSFPEVENTGVDPILSLVFEFVIGSSEEIVINGTS